jgi:xylan 1,4-beta-xylosidase
VFSAVFLLHGMKSAQSRADALAYWVVSDHFEELGRPPSLLHGGFGLMTVGNLRKPRWWALKLAQDLGDQLVPLTLEGDGAGTLVDGWAAKRPGGVVDILLWNATLDQSRQDGDPLLDRSVTVHLPRGRVNVARVDAEHSNLARHWHSKRPWPTETELADLRANDRLDDEDLGVVDGPVELKLPMPGILRLQWVKTDE